MRRRHPRADRTHASKPNPRFTTTNTRLTGRLAQFRARAVFSLQIQRRAEMKKMLLVLYVMVVGVYGATIFGPAFYYRTTGAPNVYDTMFAAFDTTVLCTLIVTNGDSEGGNRLSAASIEFNGEEIIKERDFSESVETITRVFQLTSENSLHLRLRSGPGDFLTMNIHRPCDAYVDLAVDTVIDGEACFIATAGGWGDIAYSWDFDGDGENDTTTTAPAVCITYEEADTYWANVKVMDEIGCTAQDSAEVIVPEGEEYTFDTVLTEEIWEGKDFSPTDWIFDDEGTPWILGYSDWVTNSADTFQWCLISDTLGNIDTLYSTEERTTLHGKYILRKFYSSEGADTVIYAGMEDTVINEIGVFDSLVVEPIFGSEPTWTFEYDFIEPLLIAKNGWAFVKIHKSAGADTLFSGWKYAIAHNGEPDVTIDIEGEVYIDDEYYAFNDNRLAVFASNVIGNIYTINVYDTSGALLYSTPELNWCGPACMKFEILSNGSIVYLSGNSNGVSLYRQYFSEMESFEISDTNYIAVSWAVGNNRLFLVSSVINTGGGAYRYYFDLSDSLTLIWDCEVTNRWKDSFGILANNNPCFDIGEYLEPNFSWQLKVLSALNGNIIGEWPNTPFTVRRPPITSIKSNYLLIKDLAKANPPLEPKFLIIRIEGGE